MSEPFSHCPHCGSTNLEETPLPWQGNTIICQECKAQFSLGSEATVEEVRAAFDRRPSGPWREFVSRRFERRC